MFATVTIKKYCENFIIFSSDVFKENSRYCHSPVGRVGKSGVMQEL